MECHCGSSPVGMPKLLQLHAVIPRFQGSLSWQRACRLRMPSVGFENRTKAGVLTLVDSQSLMTVPVSSWARSGSRSRGTSSAARFTNGLHAGLLRFSPGTTGRGAKRAQVLSCACGIEVTLGRTAYSRWPQQSARSAQEVHVRSVRARGDCRVPGVSPNQSMDTVIARQREDRAKRREFREGTRLGAALLKIAAPGSGLQKSSAMTGSGPTPPATAACRRGPGEILGQASSTGRSSRDVDLMEFNELVPTVACRKPMIVGAAGFWSSLVTQSWTRCPARKRRALGTSGIR